MATPGVAVGAALELRRLLRDREHQKKTAKLAYVGLVGRGAR